MSDAFGGAKDKDGPNADDEGARIMADSAGQEEVKMTVRLPESMREKFKRRCKKEGMNMSVAIRLFVRRVLDNEDDLV